MKYTKEQEKEWDKIKKQIPEYKWREYEEIIKRDYFKNPEKYYYEIKWRQTQDIGWVIFPFLLPTLLIGAIFEIAFLVIGNFVVGIIVGIIQSYYAHMYWNK